MSELCVSEESDEFPVGSSVEFMIEKHHDPLGRRYVIMSVQVFRFEQLADSLVVTPQGNLFEHRYEDIRNGYNETYRKLDDPEIMNLVVDFSTTVHFGSTFIGLLIKLAQKCRRAGGEAVLCGLSRDMREVMDSLMLLENVATDFFWVPFETREQALASLEKAAK